MVARKHLQRNQGLLRHYHHHHHRRMMKLNSTNSSLSASSTSSSEFTVQNVHDKQVVVTTKTPNQQQQKLHVTFGNVHIQYYNIAYDGSVGCKSNRPFPLTLGSKIEGRNETFSIDDYETSKTLFATSSRFVVQEKQQQQQQQIKRQTPLLSSPKRFSTQERHQKLLDMGYSNAKLIAVERLRQLQNQARSKDKSTTSRIVTTRNPKR